MKNQINTINIIGAVASASLLILSQFSLVRNAASKALKLATFRADKNTRLTGFSIPSAPQSDKKIQMTPVTSTTRIRNTYLNKTEKPLQETSVPETEKQEHKSIRNTYLNKTEKPLQETSVPETEKQEPKSMLLADKSKHPPPNSNGCPKNLDYFKKKPRPKQTPEECITCTNLISCVCSTSD